MQITEEYLTQCRIAIKALKGVTQQKPHSSNAAGYIKKIMK